ncbi:ScpA family protein [Hydrogenophilus islandicus]
MERALELTTDAIDEPIARLYGEPLASLPTDLYIPPQALRVLLAAFEGPFDLLWFLIRKNRIDLRDIPVAELTEQYLHYVAAMKALDLDLAAEYLAMAATLIELKARLLLPRTAHAERGGEGEEDPRARLVAQLSRYEAFRRAAERLDTLPRAGREFLWLHPVALPEKAAPPPLTPPTARQLAQAWWELLARREANRPHEVVEEPVTVAAVQERLLATLRSAGQPLPFSSLLPPNPGRLYLVTAFFALLELTRLGAVVLEQSEPLAPITVQWCGDSVTASPRREAHEG